MNDQMSFSEKEQRDPFLKGENHLPVPSFLRGYLSFKGGLIPFEYGKHLVSMLNFIGCISRFTRSPRRR